MRFKLVGVLYANTLPAKGPTGLQPSFASNQIERTGNNNRVYEATLLDRFRKLGNAFEFASLPPLAICVDGLD
jgi:hypothetical protein